MALNVLQVVVFALTFAVAVANYIAIDPGNGNKGLIDGNTTPDGSIQTALLNLPRGYYLWDADSKSWITLRARTYWHYLVDYVIAKRHNNRVAMDYYADKMKGAPTE
ncbi:hypothetical protein Ddc_12351 [Ditylenchus destructor]|nr:hypothetical protein Ddc_12351 [Ditylenchus destructor]